MQNKLYLGVEKLKTYNIIPVTADVLRESMLEFRSPKDKISSLTREHPGYRIQSSL
jgi:hypothetical protein